MVGAAKKKGLKLVLLQIVSNPHAYEKADKYRILVKLIDIFGNDISQAFDVEVPLT